MLPNGSHLCFGNYQEESRPLRRLLKQAGGGSIEGGLLAVQQDKNAMAELVDMLDIDAKVGVRLDSLPDHVTAAWAVTGHCIKDTILPACQCCSVRAHTRTHSLPSRHTVRPKPDWQMPQSVLSGTMTQCEWRRQVLLLEIQTSRVTPDMASDAMASVAISAPSKPGGKDSAPEIQARRLEPPWTL